MLVVLLSTARAAGQLGMQLSLDVFEQKTGSFETCDSYTKHIDVANVTSFNEI